MNDFQTLELISPRPMAQPSDVGLEGISVSYKLPQRVTVRSRSDRQTIEIAALNLKSSYYYVAAPVFGSHVYRGAELLNDTDHALLNGPATMYLDGAFVGRGEVPMTAVGQRFDVGLGADSQLRGRREMLSRNESTLGANREIVSKYRLALENFKAGPVRVRLYDRIPQPMEGSDLRVTLAPTELSADPFYLMSERPKGILRWDIEVPAQAAADKAKLVEYSYTVEFDRKLNIQNPFAAGRDGELRQKAAALWDESGMAH